LSSETVARFSNVTKRYELGKVEITALKNLSLDVKRGTFTFITGPSGSGKTTVLNLLGAIDVPSEGLIELLGRNYAQMNDNQLTDFRSQYISFIFQNFNLIPVLSVAENVEYPLALIGVKAAERSNRVAAMLEAVGLGDRAGHKPNELSGGQRQRVAIARALIKQPTLVLADEPTANLDSKTGREITELMQSMQKELNTTFVFSSHDAELISMADDVFHLVDGKLVDERIRGAA
jgi:putative ABC transport system ATP-binding protein